MQTRLVADSSPPRRTQFYPLRSLTHITCVHQTRSSTNQLKQTVSALALILKHNAAVQSCRALYDLRLNAPKGQRQTTGRHASSQSSGPEIGSGRSRTRSSVARNSAQHPLSSAAEPQQRGRRRDYKLWKNTGIMKTFTCSGAVPHCTRATGRSHRQKKTSLSNTERSRTQSHPPKPG